MLVIYIPYLGWNGIILQTIVEIMKEVENPKVEKLLEKYKQISLLNKIGAVLDWDLNVNLPKKASEGRGEQAAFLAGLQTEKWSEEEFKATLEDVLKDKAQLNEVERAIVRNLERQGRYYFRVPKEIIIEMAKTTSEAFIAWREAKTRDNFKDFSPYLHKIVHLNQIIASHLGYKDNPYDALLDLYEPGLTTAFTKTLFGMLQPELTALLKKIKTSKQFKENTDLVNGQLVYPVSDQRQLGMFIMKKMGYDLEAGRMDVSPHPFTTQLGYFDIRVTTNYKVSDFRDSFMSTIHEVGHALYEQGVSSDYTDTPLEGGVSLGVHESQSRFWENQIARSPEFIEFLTPVFQAFFQEQLSGVGSDTLGRLFNQVRTGFIRTEADEVTYNLHIVLRFELENALINGDIQVEDLPEIWREKMKKYLGVVPGTDREGVLQDVHWSCGNFGYFPTYTLGNLYAAQFNNSMRKELDIEGLLKKGELGTILVWLRENIHQYGSLYFPRELVKKVTGEELNPKYFLDYIKDKYQKIYNLR